MKPQRNDRDRRRQRPQPEPQPIKPQPQRDDDEDEGEDEGAATPGKPLKGLQHSKLAVEARWMGREPDSVNLAECMKQKGPEDPLCLLGSRGGAHCQGPQKGLNIPVIARGGMGDWGWLARLCAAQRTHGTNLNEVNGADSGTYLGEVMKCYSLAQRELRRLGRHEEAEHCRLAYRSQVALLALAAIPQARVRDRVIYGDGKRLYEGRRVDHRLPGVAVAGPRFKIPTRDVGLSTDNAAADLLARELGTVDDLGLTRDEIETVKDAIEGDVGAARVVASWCFGVLAGWWIRVRRVLTATGVASGMVFGCDEATNPYKPSIAAAQIVPDETGDGATLVRMTPAPSYVVNDKWGSGSYAVEFIDGVIRASCGTGSAELPELVGEVVWEWWARGVETEFTAT